MGDSKALSGFLDLSKPYSPILLPSFNDEEYANLPAKEDEEGFEGGAEVDRAEVERIQMLSRRSPELRVICRTNPTSYEVPWIFVKGFDSFLAAYKLFWNNSCIGN